jgi:hypothetical protein
MLNTEQFAEKMLVRPGTIRTSVCRNGSYMGIRPVKLPNRFLAWPDDAVDQIMTIAEKEQRRGVK